MKKCVHCGKDVVLADVASHFGDIFAQADCLGMESLTEDNQAIVLGAFCVDCLMPDIEEDDDGSCHSCGCQDCDCDGPPLPDIC